MLTYSSLSLLAWASAASRVFLSELPQKVSEELVPWTLTLLQGGIEVGGKLRDRHAEFLEQGKNEAVLLPDKRGKKMFAVYFLMGIFMGDALGGLERRLRLGGKTIPVWYESSKSISGACVCRSLSSKQPFLLAKVNHPADLSIGKS